MSLQQLIEPWASLHGMNDQAVAGVEAQDGHFEEAVVRVEAEGELLGGHVVVRLAQEDGVRRGVQDVGLADSVLEG